MSKGILAIRRENGTGKAVGYQWCGDRLREEVQAKIDEYNKDGDVYYEISDNEDLINLLPEHRRRYDCEDIVDRVESMTYQLREISSVLDEIDTACRNIKNKCEELGSYGDE